MCFKSRFLFVFAMAVAIGLNIFCSKKPTKPRVDVGVRLYVFDNHTTNLYVIDPDGDSAVDSLGEMYPMSVALAPDGKSLYVQNLAPGYVAHTYKIQTAPLQIIGELGQFGGTLAFVRSGEILLRDTFSQLDYIDPKTFVISATDSLGLRELATSDTVSFVVGVGSDGSTVCYDFERKEILSSDSLRLAGRPVAIVNHLSLHPSGKEGYAITHDSPELGWFFVFETPILKLKYSYRLQSFRGETAPSPDGSHVLVSDPGPLPSPPTTIGDLFVYNVTAQKVVKVIHTDTLALVDYPPVAVSQMDYSPDGKIAYISTGSRGASTGPVLIFDMEKLAFVDRVHMPHEALRIGEIAVGPAP